MPCYISCSLLVAARLAAISHRGTMSFLTLRRMACALLLIAITGCASSELHPPKTGPAVTPLSLPSLGEIARTPAATSDEFLIQQSGADYAADLPSNASAAAGSAVELSPTWSPGTSDLSAAAFCIYRLTFDPAEGPATLAFAWSGGAPVADECWVGISDWTRTAWKWNTLPESSAVGRA